MKLFLLYLLSINVVSFILFGFDKFLAIKNKSRIPEKELFTVSTIGGAIGGMFAILIFKHKISKASFIWKFMILFIINIVGIYFFLK